jgi:hypothetical protein
VSADVSAENDARELKKTPKKRSRATVDATGTSASQHEPTVAPESPQPPVTTPALEAATTSALEATAGATMAPPAESVVSPVTPQAAQPLPAPVRRPTHLRTIAVAGAMFLVVAALAFPRYPSPPATDDGAAGSQPEPREQPADSVGPSRQPVARSAAPIATPVAASATVAPRAVTAPSKKALVPKPEKNRIAESTKSAAPMATVTRVADIAFKDDTATRLPGSDAIAPASVSNGTVGATPVTITGCLEISVNQDEFRLTDTEGADAPRSRSWRTGFLKKGSAPVALVEPPDRLALQTRVGQRVAATGLLTSHDLKVSALRVVGRTCN